MIAQGELAGPAGGDRRPAVVLSRSGPRTAFRSRFASRHAKQEISRAASSGRMVEGMARVVHVRPDGALLIEVAADEAGDLSLGARVDVRRADDAVVGDAWLGAFDGLTGECPAISSADIAAVRALGGWSGASR
jgi:hypothetical protein